MEGSKQKKITVKFFLNLTVDPVKGEGRKRYYPLYVQVTYNRKNMQFKSRYSDYYENLEEVKPSLLDFEEKVIKSIVAHEAGKAKGQYDLKGLKKKYEVYSTSILEALEHYLKPKLRLWVFNTGNELSKVLNFNDASATVSILYKAADLLFKDFDTNLPDQLKEDLKAYEYYQKLYRPVLGYDFPTLIDWLDGSHKKELEKKLSTTLKLKPEMIKSIKTLIDQAAKEKLKELEN